MMPLKSCDQHSATLIGAARCTLSLWRHKETVGSDRAEIDTSENHEWVTNAFALLLYFL